MTRNDLKGYTSVQILLDGKEEVVDLNAENSEKAFIHPVKAVRSALDTKWTNCPPYYLTDDDVASLIENGPHNLFSRISLISLPSNQDAP